MPKPFIMNFIFILMDKNLVQPKYIRVSLGSAILLGLKKGKITTLPTTIYLLMNGKCRSNCAFCSQAREASSKKDRLSRVIWPKYELNDVFISLKNNNFKRICIQTLNYPKMEKDLFDIVNMIKENTDIPISVATHPLEKKSLDYLKELGVNRIGISLDGSSKQIFENIKGKKTKSPYSWLNHLNGINLALGIFGKENVTTHLIVGLGETDKELLQIIKNLHDKGVCCSLFAFTPLKGTKLEKQKKPKIERYRAVQLSRYLIIKNKINFNEINFNDNGKLLKIPNKIELISEMFQTSGCPNCNRPYYNENVRGPIYNYPNKLEEKNLVEARFQLIKYEAI